MFRLAFEKACKFTQPVISYWKTVEGKCEAGLGAFVVVNNEGWIVTAAHIVLQAQALATADADARNWESQRDAIKADAALSAKERSRKLSALGTPNKRSPRRVANSWGHNRSDLHDVQIVEAADIAIGRLDPFDPAWIQEYPEFKDPTKEFTPGRSLCKLGYPFHDIKPTYDETTNVFDIPPDMRAIPFFPIEGMFTRTLIVPPPPNPPAFPLRFVETSSPGLRGQSGGPTFDAKGAIWAIQSRTKHQPLGFSPEITDGGKVQKEHQFLNVGMGTDVITVIGLLNQFGVAHRISAF